MKDWKQRDEEKLHYELDAYLVARDKHEKNKGQPNRYLLKNDYRAKIEELFYRMPEDYHYRGFVFHKAMIGSTRTIQIYTEESFKRAQDYLKRKK